MSGLTDAERAFLDHMLRWGSDGYPIRKLRTGRWVFESFRGAGGNPSVFTRKRDAVDACERYVDVLLDKHAGRLP